MNPREAFWKNVVVHSGEPVKAFGQAFAPINIALVKYWGKRDSCLHLPKAPSLSVTLPTKGVWTRVARHRDQEDRVWLDGVLLSQDHPVYRRIQGTLNELRVVVPGYYRVETRAHVPVAAGLASSAAGAAALVLALDDYYGWGLSLATLSALARLGSGSACRSLWPGFVRWEPGHLADGRDSIGVPLAASWPALRVGVMTCDASAKALSSRQAMAHCQRTSSGFDAWLRDTHALVPALESAIEKQDFEAFGAIAERSARGMHAVMEAASPPVVYSQASTLEARRRVEQARDHLPIYWTQDAGPALKLLVLASDLEEASALFPEAEWLQPFPGGGDDQVVRVDGDDNQRGTAPKLLAHQMGWLHRAFSVVVVRQGRGVEWLLQRRALGKYHGAGLWSNACCSHPRPWEDIYAAAHRRLGEELGLTLPLRWSGAFSYRAVLDEGLIEHEYDHVLVGQWQGESLAINTEEVSEVAWVPLHDLKADLAAHPRRYSPWLAGVIACWEAGGD